jgi:hypothetical protein
MPTSPPPTTPTPSDSAVLADLLAVVRRHGLDPGEGARLLRRAARRLQGEAHGREVEAERMVPGVPRHLEHAVLLGELTVEEAVALGKRE